MRSLHGYYITLIEESKDIMDLDINLNVLNYEFESKPILIGGKALEYYGVRDSDNDFDFVISEDDYDKLSYKYPDNIKDLSGDLGICVRNFELWRSICLLDYEFFLEGAIEEDDFYVVSFDRLMFMKVLSISSDKSKRDLELMKDRMAVINTIYHDYY